MGPLWKELQAKGTISFPRFFLRRSFRIWPYYYFALLAWTLWHPAEHPRVQVSELFFFANYVRGGGIPGSWSLSTEEQFYILAPLLILVVRRRIPLWGYFVVFGALEAAIVAARYHTVGVIAASGGRFGYFEQLHLHADGLLFGLGLSLLSVLRPAWLRPDRGRPLRGWAVFAAGCAVAFGLYAINREVYNLLSLAIIFTSLTYALLTDPSPLQRLWRWRGFQTFSMLSFGMYLNQFLVLSEFGRFWGRATKGVLPPNLSFFLGFALGVALCCALAAVTYVLIEHPFLMVRDRRLKPPQLADIGWKPGAADQPAS